MYLVASVRLCVCLKGFTKTFIQLEAGVLRQTFQLFAGHYRQIFSGSSKALLLDISMHISI